MGCCSVFGVLAVYLGAVLQRRPDLVGDDRSTINVTESSSRIANLNF
jgi:hypothetical protein